MRRLRVEPPYEGAFAGRVTQPPREDMPKPGEARPLPVYSYLRFAFLGEDFLAEGLGVPLGRGFLPLIGEALGGGAV